MFFNVLGHGWFSLQSPCEDSNDKNSSILFTYMGESHGENTRGNLLFWFSLQGGMKVQKRVLFFSFAWISPWRKH